MGGFSSGCWVSRWRGSGRPLRTPPPRACRWAGGPQCGTARCWSEWPCREQTDWGRRQSGSRRAARLSPVGSPPLLSSTDESERRYLETERDVTDIYIYFINNNSHPHWERGFVECFVCSYLATVQGRCWAERTHPYWRFWAAASEIATHSDTRFLWIGSHGCRTQKKSEKKKSNFSKVLCNYI